MSSNSTSVETANPESAEADRVSEKKSFQHCEASSNAGQRKHCSAQQEAGVCKSPTPHDQTVVGSNVLAHKTVQQTRVSDGPAAALRLKLRLTK